MKIRFQPILFTALCCAVVVGNAKADQANQEAEQTQVAVAQVDAEPLPADNVAYFSDSRQVKVKLDLLSALQDEATELANAQVTVVRPSGKTSRLKPDNRGVVTIDNVESGLNVLTVSSDRVHGTTVLNFKKQPAAADQDDLSLAPDAEPTQMTLLKIKAETLRSALDRIADIKGMSKSSINLDDVGDRFNYRVKLGADGLLLGRLVLVDRNDQTSINDVNITIYFNGNQVGSTTSDSDGNFELTGVRPGVHGLVASGKAGYAAFAFRASAMSGVVDTSTAPSTLVSTAVQSTDVLPVVLVPPTMITNVVESITKYYPRLNEPSVAEQADPLVNSDTIGDPIGPIGSGAGSAPYGGAPMGGGGFSGGGSGSAGLGGGSGIAGLAGTAAVISAIDNNDDNAVVTPSTPVSPSVPAN
ncbi:hypothetical protein Poly51_57680 [Rubripirellula tenax]|uniref:Cna protein B-type domain protein n=1 Tax=Rubripirellula tenax TaxID=2528015 RepID=A0A5C6EBK7_9BACT|nr:carboxypeptidase-like regulatory domain-containing protein [Rubripirellula tenax]TWU46372.1 hypothetical protein Poly51_57680 [Rubripirellula tenax]